MANIAIANICYKQIFADKKYQISRNMLTLRPDFPRCLYLSPGMTPLPRTWQSEGIAGLLPVKISIPSSSSMASIDAIGALPLQGEKNYISRCFECVLECRFGCDITLLCTVYSLQKGKTFGQFHLKWCVYYIYIRWRVNAIIHCHAYIIVSCKSFSLFCQ